MGSLAYTSEIPDYAARQCVAITSRTGWFAQNDLSGSVSFQGNREVCQNWSLYFQIMKVHFLAEALKWMSPCGKLN